MPSFLPERPLQFQATLAATLGLEEAVLVGVLQNFYRSQPRQPRNGFNWVTVDAGVLLEQVPFWTEADIQRICTRLHEVGLLLFSGAGFSASQPFVFAFNDHAAAVAPRPAVAPPVNSPAPAASAASSASHSPIAREWQPSQDAFRQLSQLGVPRHFVQEQVAQFVAYWRDRNEPRYSWESKFIKEVIRQWREEESRQNARGKEIPMGDNWRPSRDAIQILQTQGGVHPNFVEDAIPEFVLYWRDRGERSSTWNSKFIHHVRRQWFRYTTLQENDTEPSLIQSDWQPSGIVFDVLQMANIDRAFAEALIPEFILYWQETGAPNSKWSTLFLQHVKRVWASRSATQVTQNEQRPRSADRISDRSIAESLSDRSWAY